MNWGHDLNNSGEISPIETKIMVGSWDMSELIKFRIKSDKLF